MVDGLSQHLQASVTLDRRWSRIVCGCQSGIIWQKIHHFIGYNSDPISGATELKLAFHEAFELLLQQHQISREG